MSRTQELKRIVTSIDNRKVALAGRPYLQMNQLALIYLANDTIRMEPKGIVSALKREAKLLDIENELINRN